MIRAGRNWTGITSEPRNLKHKARMRFGVWSLPGCGLSVCGLEGLGVRIASAGIRAWASGVQATQTATASLERRKTSVAQLCFRFRVQTEARYPQPETCDRVIIRNS
eukprot:251063-Rhodomonas_salina.4